MKKDKTEVVIILDRSGSMQSIKSDVEGGLKAFIEKQRKEPGECRVSCYQFDDKYETVFEDVDIRKVRPIKVEPRGWTALIDAIGRTTEAVGRRLAETPETQRPEKVIVVVLSDGYENSSKEYTREKVREMVQHQESKYSWSYIYLGTNQNAILSGTSYGFTATKSLSFANNTAGIANAFDILCYGATCLRSYDMSKSADRTLYASYSFSPEQRDAAMAGTNTVPPTP